MPIEHIVPFPGNDDSWPVLVDGIAEPGESFPLRVFKPANATRVFLICFDRYKLALERHPLPFKWDVGRLEGSGHWRCGKPLHAPFFGAYRIGYTLIVINLYRGLCLGRLVCDNY